MRSGTPTLLVMSTCLALLTSATAVPATAEATSYAACTPSPPVDASFCVGGEIVLADHARDPVGLTLTLANGSASYASDTNKWISTVRLTFTPPEDGAFGIAGSQSMPHNLVIAGAGATCTGADSSGCAGTGIGRVYLGAPFNTFYNVSVGIRRLTNINPPGAGLRAQYLAAGSMCADGLGACSDIEFPIDVPVGSASEFSAEFPTRFQGTLAGATYDGAIASLDLSISGVSSEVWNGSGTDDVPLVRVLSMPNRCGSVAASVSASTGEATPRTATATTLAPVSGCPIARFSAQPDGFVARFAGGASSAIEGRAVTQWRWTFGDGTSKITSFPTTSHRYTTYGNHKVALVAVDDEGARSAPVTNTVQGTTTAVDVAHTAEKVRAFGRVSPSHAGKNVALRLQRKRDGRFRTIDTAAATLNDDSRYTKRFARPAQGTCRVRATFGGDADHLASRAAKTFNC